METPVFREAVYLASRDLFDSLPEGSAFADLSERQKLSVWKYLLRKSAHCTLFSRFAGCGTDVFSENNQLNQIVVDGLNGFQTVTRLDMDFITIITQFITLPAQPGK
ncbi:lantibiotic dehydratase [Pedobacter sandarakinus]|uniref:lantibiotic dehydratase n=1 Tax=Pedobacter sandarakinus TaxID=353156 RepID=UPI003898FFE8